MRTLHACGKYILAGAATLAALASLDPAHAGVRVLHTFDLSDGDDPDGVLVEDTAGNLYGTTVGGGSGGCYKGCGTVFKLAPNGTHTVLYAFTGGSDGDGPQASLIEDSAGNLYGTTYDGGTGCTFYGCGTVFKIAPDGTKTTLYSFKGGTDGATPYSALIAGNAGKFYGTTWEGGGTGCSGYGCGTVFELAVDGTETVLHAFAGGSDGALPSAGLIKDKAGNLYGTTGGGGSGSCDVGEDLGCGTIFEVAPDGTETVLHAFLNVRGHGYDPGGLMQDKKAHLIGTTFNGGIRSCFGWPGRSRSPPAFHPRGCGIVFRLERHRLQA